MEIIGWSVVQKPRLKPKLPKSSMCPSQKSNYNKVRTSQIVIFGGKGG